jgi:SAM-dependent methyltransferase
MLLKYNSYFVNDGRSKMVGHSGTWREIWEQKGSAAGTEANILVYDGWEKSQTPVDEVARRISDILDIHPNDRVLEVGCGAGAISKYLDCDYVGVDFSRSLLKRNIEFYGNQCVWGEAADLPFKEGLFDKVFCFGVFLYFESKVYAEKAISEMKRVTRNGGGIFFGDIPMRSHSDKHLLYSKQDFGAWNGQKIIDGWCKPYEHDRFNVFISHLRKD